MPTLTNILRTILQGDARSYVQATQQAGTATDRFARSVLSANAALKRTERVRADLGADEFEKQLEAFKQTEGALQRQKALRADLTRTQGNLTRAEVVATGAAVAFDAALGRVIETGTQRQTSRLVFGNLFGPAEGGQMFERLGRFAARSPFSADAVRGSALALREMGVETRDILPDLQAIGNASARLGQGDEGITRLSEALAQAKQQHAAAPFIGAMESLNMDPFGILQRRTGMLRPQIQALSSDFYYSDQLLKTLLDDMKDQGGGRAMEDRMGTAEVATKNFHDSVKQLGDALSVTVLPGFTGATKGATDFINAVSKWPGWARNLVGGGLAVGAGGATLAATVGIPVAQAVTTYRLAQALKAAQTGEMAAAAGGAGTAGGLLGRIAGGFGGGAAGVLGPAAVGGALGYGAAKLTGVDPIFGGGPLRAFAEWLVGGGRHSAAMPPAEQAHLAELQEQTRLLQDIRTLQANAISGNGVFPFSTVPYARQMQAASQGIQRKR